MTRGWHRNAECAQQGEVPDRNEQKPCPVYNDPAAQKRTNLLVGMVAARLVEENSVDGIDIHQRERHADGAYSGEVDQGSGVMPISVPVDSDQVIGAERRWQSDCVGSDRNRQEEVGSERGFGAKRR